MSAAVIWVVIGVVCLIAEAMTLTFVVAYFGIGAIAAAVAAALGAPIAGQVGVFGAVSLTLLAFTRKVIVDLVQDRRPVLSNVHALIGKGAVVTIAVSNHASTGQIRVGTEFWTARNADGDEPIAVGARVDVTEVTGVTAYVRERALEPPAP